MQKKLDSRAFNNVRRTVAKYRKLAGIPPTHIHRHHKNCRLPRLPKRSVTNPHS
ncbi:hypothetical protein [Gloeocapsopsis crepidinum]|uniref:hypothetical protein n=1 Tax=Gloeocapsopsis crepidinum TaxID=693223 RepID=UPI0038991ED6